MLSLRKLNKRASSRHQIAIKGVEKNLLILPKDEYRIIIKTSSINFHLMNESEQDALIDTYRAFLNSLPFALQIVHQVRALNLDDYLVYFEKRREEESLLRYKDQISSYMRYVSSLVEIKKVLTRQFYIVIPYRSPDGLDLAREQLTSYFSIVERGLSNIGIRSYQLTNLEILDLLYSSYNPTDFRLQPLTERTLYLLYKNYF
ncbi:MAG TPA: hypothetical protein VJ841_03815 [Candidatus Saccharimonadales bacterium]|nr:hypothetical protein [Candidatus Saccharimonadales bacterium]